MANCHHIRVARWQDGRVSVEDSVATNRTVSGKELHDRYMTDITVLTLGLARMRGTSMRVGPVELLRFGAPRVSKSQVNWPIEGGLAAGAPGGSFRVRSTEGRLLATLEGYRPRVPPPVYTAMQLPVHHLLTRLYLLRVRGREPVAGPTPPESDRVRSASVDLAMCLTLVRLTGRRRIGRAIVFAAAYHAVCWTVWGRTLGGMVTRQRVVAVDGSPLTLTQSLLRFALLPLSWITRQPIHDEIAQSAVISG